MEDAIWIETTHGGLLRQLFGHYPTLHNARLTTIEIDRKLDLATAEIDYADETDNDDAILRVRIRLEWHGIQTMDLSFQGSEIMAISFEKQGAWIVTRFAPCVGAYGSIVAERFEAILTQAESLPVENEGVRLRFR